MTVLRVAIGPNDHLLGDDDAPRTLVEYGDYECPHCGAAYVIAARIQEHFGSRLKFVYRHSPLTQIHPNSASAAETAEFAGAHGKFWDAHDLLFENQDRLGLPLFFAIIRALRLPEQGLREALAGGAHADKVQTDFRGGIRSGVNGTPTFFINGQRHDGTFRFEELVATLEGRGQYATPN